jgi:transcription antitermination factor NusG
VSELDSTHGWYALYTRHQHEKAVHQELMGKGYESFLPLYTSARQWKDRVKRLSLPLIPCYVFIREPLTYWLPVLSTPGVHSVVAFAGRPASIPCAEIEAVRRVVESQMKAEAHPYLRCGDRVRVIAGALRGLEGILIRKKNWYKLLLSIELLQRSVAVEIDVTMVERVAGAANDPPPDSPKPHPPDMLT